MPRSWSAADIRGEQERLRDISFEAKLNRLKKLRGTARGVGAPGAFGGPEFTRAKALYGELGGLGMPEDIGGIEDLTAAERAQLVEQQETIGGQLGTAQEELRNLVGRMGGGGSEAIEAAEGMRVGAIGARAAALRGALTGGQARVEARRGEALRGREVAAGGLGSLAKLRETGGQWRGSQAMQRYQMLMNEQQMMMNMMDELGGGGGRPDVGPTMGGYGTEWAKFTPESEKTRMQMRKQFLWPTQYGRKQATTYPQRGAYSYF